MRIRISHSARDAPDFVEGSEAGIAVAHATGISLRFNRVGADGSTDDVARRLGAIDDKQPAGLRVEPALDQIVYQRLHDGGLLGCSFDQASRSPSDGRMARRSLRVDTSMSRFIAQRSSQSPACCGPPPPPMRFAGVRLRVLAQQLFNGSEDQRSCPHPAKPPQCSAKPRRRAPGPC